MNPVRVPNATRILHAPSEWDDKRGKCESLSIVDNEDVMYSYWKPTLKERIAILFGYNVRLCIVGNSHPPVALDTKK